MQPASMDVISKEGMLYLQGLKFGKKTWRKIWMGLFKASSTGVGRLEFFTVADSNPGAEPKKAGRQKTPVRKVVRLSDCLSVTFAPKASCPEGCTAFHLNTTRCTYTFASTTSQDWLSTLCLLAFQKDPGDSDKGNFEEGTTVIMEDNDLYSSLESVAAPPPNHFHITVLSTEASRRCKLSGDYLFSSDGEAMVLLAITTGHIVCRWPYRLLRKFGQVEGGFSIEAGRRCESGEGVFTFLTRHGPQIFRVISQHCSAEERTPPAQPRSSRRESLPATPPVGPPAAASHLPGRPDVSADTDNESACHYSTINDFSFENAKQLSLVKPRLSSSKEDLGEEFDDDDEEGLCYSLEALDEDIREDNIYYNFRPAMPTPMRREQLEEEMDNSECVYSQVNRGDSPSNLQPLFPPHAQFGHQLPPCALPKAAPQVTPKPRNQFLPPVDDQTASNTQSLAGDDTRETEEATGSAGHVTPTEIPGSFKHRLAAIISKDLAKLQPPPPYGAGSPTFSQ